MPYKTGHVNWSGLDLGLFIGPGVLVTAGLYEYVPSVNSQYTGLNLVPLAPQTPAGVLCRSAAFPLGMKDRADRKVAGSEASRGDKKDQRVFAKFGQQVATGCLGRDADGCRSREDARQGAVHYRRRPYSYSTESKKTSEDVVDGKDNKEVLEDAVNKRGTAQCPPNTAERTDHNNAAVSSENDVTECDDDQELVKELKMSNSDISDQKSPYACPLGGGQVSEGNAGKDHGVCGDDITSDVTSDVMNTCSRTNLSVTEKTREMTS
ncbi:uncharacterized protein LOC118427161 [Branchiostoma floridae]|uniref:Uncharacterized protein LOC118427161 n=1 Tax=Branchiostoma floridae TaxID=7739 RepID=A0A9J7M162_BRAFL|nr:uncharacterized protein LOC118427161 [Branchiostoma floridae]